MTTKRLTTIALFTAMMIVFTIVIPKIPVPIININVTLQTFVVMLAGLLLGPTDAFLSMLLYVLIGALGFPVFSGLSGGIGPIVGPTGGFILSFPIVAYLISLFHFKKMTLTKNIIVSSFFGIIMIYILGSIWLSFYSELSLLQILIGMFAFIPMDVVKCLFASIISLRLESSGFSINHMSYKRHTFES